MRYIVYKVTVTHFCAGILTATAPGAGGAAPFSAKKELIAAALPTGVSVYPATWQNLLIMKNLALEYGACAQLAPLPPPRAPLGATLTVIWQVGGGRGT